MHKRRPRGNCIVLLLAWVRLVVSKRNLGGTSVRRLARCRRSRTLGGHLSEGSRGLLARCRRCRTRGIVTVRLGTRRAVVTVTTTANLLLGHGYRLLGKRRVVRSELFTFPAFGFPALVLPVALPPQLILLPAAPLFLKACIGLRLLVRLLARAAAVGLDRAVAVLALVAVRRCGTRRSNRVATCRVTKALVGAFTCRRRSDAAGELRGVFTLDELLGVELKDLQDGLGVLLVVVLGDGRCGEQPLPLRRQTNKGTAGGVEADVDAVGEVGGVANATHARAALVDGVYPAVDIIVRLDLADEKLSGAVAGW